MSTTESGAIPGGTIRLRDAGVRLGDVDALRAVSLDLDARTVALEGSATLRMVPGRLSMP